MKVFITVELEKDDTLNPDHEGHLESINAYHRILISAGITTQLKITNLPRRKPRYTGLNDIEK